MKRLWIVTVFAAAFIGLFAMGMLVMPAAETFLMSESARPSCDPTHPNYPKETYASEPCGWVPPADWMWRQSYPERGAVIGLGLMATGAAVGVALFAAAKLDKLEKASLANG